MPFALRCVQTRQRLRVLISAEDPAQIEHELVAVKPYIEDIGDEVLVSVATVHAANMGLSVYVVGPDHLGLWTGVAAAEGLADQAGA